MHRLRQMAPTLILLLCASSARADWQYTRWGMTAAEAKAASQGKLVDRDGGPERRFLLTGTHEANGDTFVVNLVFAQPGEHLELVNLEHDSSTACAHALTALRGRATPEVVSSEEGAEEYLWRDVEKGNIVNFSNNEATKARSAGAFHQSCYIQYRPIPSADNGL